MNWPFFSRRASLAVSGGDAWRPRTAIAVAPLPSGRAKAGQDRALFEYLDKRYADAVVLTFQQIQDLLGTELPEAARTDTGWWSDSGGRASDAQAPRAWTLANRTARPNLQAETVAFERIS